MGTAVKTGCNLRELEGNFWLDAGIATTDGGILHWGGLTKADWVILVETGRVGVAGHL